MPYATPAQHIQRFGLAETTATLADEQQLLTAELLLDALGQGGFGGQPSQAEQDAATAAAARLVRQLEVTSNVMDGYLRSAVTLPLAPADANAGTLEECCCALARCALNDDSDNATERMDKCCDSWRAWLKDVAARRVQLVGAAGQTPAATGGVRFGQATSAVPWGMFGGVRGPGAGGWRP